MASVSMAMPLTTASQKGLQSPSLSGAFMKPLQLKPSNKAVLVNSKLKARLQVQASLKEKAITGLTAAALTASMVMPDAAEAAASAFSPSLNNFLLSIAAGGAVLVAILWAVVGVSNFDPVNRS